jgi:alkylation response protein AidB-like acyl-CoA dehydrogenase
MDFELTEDQIELQRIVREVAEAECPPSLVRAVAEGGDGVDVDGLWKTYVQLDWPSLTVPVEDGGMGATAVELAITLEELGRVADPTPFLATTSHYVPLVRTCVDADQRKGLLGAVCSGATGTATFDPGGLVAARDGDGWRLDGVVRHVLDGDRADQLALVAATDAGPGVFLLSTADVVATLSPSFDASLHVAEVRLDGVMVDGSRAFCGDDVESRIEKARLEALGGLAATTVGASQRILELVLDHVRSRHQFGQPIGAFQAVKHMLVDVYVAIERARALSHFAALTVAEDDDRQVLAASMAKAAAGDCQRIAIQHGIQLFGGLGFTWENDLQLFVRRAKAGELLGGSTARHRALVGRMAMAASLAAQNTEGGR